MRIVVDVTPLSQPRTGIGNYLLGMLRGTSRGCGRKATSSSRSPWLVRVARLRNQGSGGQIWPVEQPDRRCPHPLPTRGEPRGAGSASRRSSVLAGALDVFHFSDWMYPAQRGGLRTTTVYDLSPLHHHGGVAPLTQRMHGRKYANAAKTGDLIFAISQFTAEDVRRIRCGFPRERIPVAYPGVDERYTPQGPQGRARRAVRPGRGDARAAQEPVRAPRASPCRRRPSRTGAARARDQPRARRGVRQVAGRPSAGQRQRRGVEAHAQHGTSVSERCSESMQMGLAAGPPGEALRMLEPERDEALALRERSFDARRRSPPRSSGPPAPPRRRSDSSSDGWDEATTGVPHAIASTTGIPKPSKSDGYANDVRAAVELGQLVVGNEAERRHAVTGELLRSPSGRARRRRRARARAAAARTSAMRRDERGQVLARLERRHGEDVRLVALGPAALGRVAPDRRPG